MSNNITLICYWNGRVVIGRRGVCYDGPPPHATLIRAGASYEEFMDELYHVTRYRREYERLEVTCRYPVRKEYIALPITDQETLDIAFAVVTPPGNSLELYIDSRTGDTTCHEAQPSGHALFPSIPTTVSSEGGTPMQYFDPTPEQNDVDLRASDDDSSSDDGSAEGPAYEPRAVDLNSVPMMLVQESMQFFQAVEQENVQRQLTDEEIIAAEAAAVDPDSISYMEARTSEFENASAWADVAVASTWTPFAGVSQPADDGSIYEGQVSASKQDVVHAIKTWSIKTHQQYRVYKSSKTLLKLKCSRLSECLWSLRAAKRRKDDMWEIRKYKGPHSCVNPLMNKEHRQLDVPYISTIIKPLVRAEVSISVAAIQAAVSQITGSYSCTYRKAWMAKQKAIADLFGDWTTSYAMLPPYMEALRRENPGTVVVWRSEDGPSAHTSQFLRVFWSFGPSIEGFPSCRPVISIDGTHLYGKYRGTMLVAVGVDANDQLFPLAFAIVEGENNDSWGWFMACIRMRVTQRADLCVISDRHRSIIAAMNDDHLGWGPGHAHHRFCIRHLASNFHSRNTHLVNVLTCRFLLGNTHLLLLSSQQCNNMCNRHH